MSDQWREELGRLFMSIENRSEVRGLLSGLLTPAEYDEIAARWQIIKLLKDGYPQRDVADALGVSVATVIRGARELKYGSRNLHVFYERMYGKKKAR